MSIFLITDIEGSTRLWQEDRAAMAAAMARHDALLAETIAAFGGRVVAHTGDGVRAAFDDGDPYACALELQRLFQRAAWGEIGELRVRIALHAGEGDPRTGDLAGPAVHVAARLEKAGWGGEIIVSAAAADEGKLPPGARLEPLGTHRLPDLEQPIKIFQLKRADLVLLDFPPLRTLTPRASNLPPQATPFVGRAVELAQASSLLASPACRLLTLHGPGGTGKTRLALQAAAENADNFPGGVYFVPLAPVASPEYVVGALAAAVKFPFAPRQNPKDQLINFFGSRAILLVLDSFEHVTAAAPLLADVLVAAPGVKILATSRERLNVYAENVCEVGGMRCPPSPDAKDFENYGSVKLFRESARRARPSYEITPADRPAIIRICEAVRGLPLALELAGAWSRTLSPAEIADELESGAGFLDGSAAEMPERHRSLRAVFEYSYQLLSEQEQRALAALSVFRGTFDRRAARGVAGASLAELAALVDKSLVSRTPGGRYEVHHLILIYTYEKLRADARAAEKTSACHAAYYTAFLAARVLALSGGGQQRAQAEISEELDNVRAAWDYMVEQRDAPLLAQAAEGLYAYYRLRGSFQEGSIAFARARAALEPQARAAGEGGPLPLNTYARMLAGEGNFYAQLARYDEAEKTLRRAVGGARRAGATREVVLSLNGLAGVAFYRGDRSRSRRLSKAALKLAAAIGDQSEAIPAFLNLAFCAKAEVDYAEARRLYGEALAVARALGDTNRAAIITNNLGNIERALGNLAAAQELYEQSRKAAEEVGNRRLLSFSLNNIGNLAHMAGRLEEARRYFEESLRIKEELNDRRQMPETITNLAGVLAEMGDYEGANRVTAQGIRISRELGLRGKTALCLERMARNLMAAGDYAACRETLAEAIREARAARDSAQTAGALIVAAELAAHEGKAAKGVELLAAIAAERFPVDTITGARRALDTLRGTLDAAAFDAAADRGRGQGWAKAAAALFPELVGGE